MGKSWNHQQDLELSMRWNAGDGIGAISNAMGRTRNSIIGRSNRLNLQFQHGDALVLDNLHPAAKGARSIFRSRVTQPKHGEMMLKSGANQRKLGKAVTKGAWKGMPIFSLTLEERRTCPETCQQWLSCYGNNMGRAKRYEIGPSFLRRLENELCALQLRHPGGFVVRLHILGDFYSVAYVEFWRRALGRYSGLRVFGYSARQLDESIGRAIDALRTSHWPRFAIRTSGAPAGSGQPRTIVLLEVPHARPGDGLIVCPAQTGGTRCCGSCGLCWALAAKHRTIAFLQH